MIYFVITLVLIAGAFLAGKTISDRYNERLLNELEYLLKIQVAEKGLGYIAPPKRVPIGQPFMDKLKENGRATQALRTSRY